MQSIVQNFSSPIALKLDEENYLRWKKQVEATIEGYDLLKHITGEEIPEKFASDEDRIKGSVSQVYQNWKKQDALLKSWLLASMTKPFTTRMVGCDFSHQIWKRLETFFESQIKAKVRQLKNKLGNIKKEGSVCDYLLEIKKTVDALISIGAVINDSDHDEAILGRLTEEYASFITTINARSDSISIGELEALLMAQEEMIEKFKKGDGIIQANFSQFHQQQKFIPRNQSHNDQYPQRFNPSARSQNFRGRGGGRHG